MPEFTIDITSIVLAVLAAVVGYVALQLRGLKNAAQDAIAPNWRWLLEDAADTAVRVADQIKTENTDKLEWAIEYVDKFLAQNHIELDAVLVRGAVEDAYLAFKTEIEE
jgi:hypothetical protein